MLSRRRKKDEMSYLKEWFVDEFLPSAIATLLIGGLIFGFFKFSFFLNEKSCYERTKYMGFDVNYDIWAGCQIEVEKGKWIPLESYYFKEE